MCSTPLENTQGSLYILGERLVQLLNGIRDLLQLFPMEDAMIGNWLLGVDKVANQHSKKREILCVDVSASVSEILQTLLS